MANMFSGKSDKYIPKTLEECTERDATATNLHIWSERLEKWGKILFWFLIIYGVLTAITTSIITEEVVHGTYYQWTETETTFNFVIFLTSIAETVLYAFLEYCAYHVLALLVSSLALITQNTIISANVALYEASHCATANATITPDEVATASSSHPQTHTNKPNTPPTPGTWACKHCGTNNSTNYSQCKKCGKFRS
ncbi:MAG: hypothetical protein IJN60_04335 [Oscillospiraceae bacterium]|nr:hypothetical protein [Oscillospiraceae bacterium]